MKLLLLEPMWYKTSVYLYHMHPPLFYNLKPVAGKKVKPKQISSISYLPYMLLYKHSHSMIPNMRIPMVIFRDPSSLEAPELSDTWDIPNKNKKNTG